MAASPNEITFIVPGQVQAPESAAVRGATRGRASTSVRVGAQRGGGDPVRVTARPGEDVVVLTVANGPSLVLHPEHARDLLLAQAPGATRDALGRSAAGGVSVLPQLGWPGLEAAATRGATRGWMGQAVLSGFEVITGAFKDTAVDLATAAVTRKLDGQVDEGVYPLAERGPLLPLKGTGTKQAQVKPAPDGGPLLVMVHGTFVDTVSTFGKLWNLHPQIVRDLFARYGGRVYAFDHPTLSKSPIGNALALASALPAGAKLHLVTHSRGGLVAEVLARACGGAVSDDELGLFEGGAYDQHRADLRKLVKIARDKGLKVERMVRVACPSHGTLLASKRLDAYLSVLQWGLELAQLPVVPEIVDFLHEVARRRADPTQLPGLEAMMPESAVVKWLNSRSEPIPGELRVVAGDMEGDSIGSWVKTLLSDAFYWTDNDLVVQTRSMYGGVPRAAAAAGTAASFLLDRGGKVSHFNYFANDRTAGAIAAALMEDAPEDFSAIGPLSWAGKEASGTRAARAQSRSRGEAATKPGDRPAVFVLPGILGSNLALNGKRIWLGLGFLNALHKLEWNAQTAVSVKPDGAIAGSYDDLMDRLGDTHEVIEFAFDWRRPIEDEANRLALEVDKALSARSVSGQPVRMLAHSMGGLVARTLQLEKPDTWKRMMAHEGARLLMLGTPNGGSWAPMQTLSGDDTFNNTLAALGSLFDNRGARKMMAGLPGFIQLQAGLADPALGLDREAAWQKLVDDDIAALTKRNLWHDPSTQLAVYQWSAPPQAVLDQAVALRRRLDAQRAALTSADTQKMLLVVGNAPYTPAGYELGSDGLEYLNAPDTGDGRVTVDNALLPGVATWKVDAAHGKLPDVPSAFAGYVELLTTGKTDKLEPYQPPSRAARSSGTATAPAALVRSRPSRGLDTPIPPSAEADVMGQRTGDRARARSAAVSVKVINGDLQFVRQPLLIGHYRSMKLTGAEWVIDRLVGESMSEALKAGLYPDAPGSHQMFGNQRPNPDNPLEMARPKAVMVVGLGEEGKLREVELVYTVRQAVLAYAQRLSESAGEAPSHFEIAATLIGSGGTGISPGKAARAIAQGVLEANGKIQKQKKGWPRIGQLILIEQYLDRASEAWQALRRQEQSAPSRLKVVGKVESAPGALRRTLDSSYRGANHDFVSALKTPLSDDDRPCIAFTLDTKRARTEVHAQHAQGTLLRQLVENASNDANTDPQIGRTLFNLLVPMEIESLLGGTGELLLEVDPVTASIPWEMLDTNPDDQNADPRPWAIRSKLVRKLRLEDFREKVRDASLDDSVLVIGEPLCDPAKYPRLDGAAREAVAVAAQLSMPGRGIPAEKVHALVDQPDAQAIINALFERPYRIVHIAGHGEVGAKGGVVLSGADTYLGATEVEAMRVVPELVFLNCCHLAGRDALAPPNYDRAKFAANIAEALIRIGVRCVVAAGWAVEDQPAADFATSFYATLLAGGRFIDAVGAARAAARKANPQGNTWAAYQCYGDPEWSWKREGSDAQSPPRQLSEELEGVASPVSLTLALENLSIGSKFGGRKPEDQLDRLRYLEAEFAPLWGGMGAVAESFGVAYSAANETAKAVAWFQAALAAQDGSASFKAAEQLANLEVRQAEKADDVHGIEQGVARLQNLLAVQSTFERRNLLGSAYKRLSMAQGRAKRPREAKAALAEAVAHYGAAAEIAQKAGNAAFFYPARNGLSCAVRAAFLDGSMPALDPVRVKSISDAMQKAATENPEFWSVAGQSELLLLDALASGRLAKAEPGAMASLRDLKARVPAPWLWDSVYNEAQFTMLPYIAMKQAAAAEQRAAQRVLDELKKMAA